MNVLILFEIGPLGLNIMRCLADTGIRCYAFSTCKAWDVRFSKYCKEYVECLDGSFRSCSPELTEQINRYCIRRKIDCLIPADYGSALYLSKISSSLIPQVKMIPLAKTETLERLNSKWEFSLLLKELGISQPQTHLVENLEQLHSMPVTIPCVVKPLKGSGRWTGSKIPGSYVKKDHAEYLASAQQGFPLLVQEFIPGMDFCINLLAVQGKITVSSLQKCVDENRRQFIKSSELLELAQRIVAHTNYQGVAGIDVRMDQRDGSFKFLECNPRFWGSLRAAKWNGVNFPLEALNASMGTKMKEKILSKDCEYVSPFTVLTRLLKGDLPSLKNLPETTYRDLWQIITDPLSCFISISLSLKDVIRPPMSQASNVPLGVKESRPQTIPGVTG